MEHEAVFRTPSSFDLESKIVGEKLSGKQSVPDDLGSEYEKFRR